MLRNNPSRRDAAACVRAVLSQQPERFRVIRQKVALVTDARTHDVIQKVMVLFIEPYSKVIYEVERIEEDLFLVLGDDLPKSGVRVRRYRKQGYFGIGRKYIVEMSSGE